MNEMRKAQGISKYPVGFGIVISSHKITTGIIGNNANNVYLEPSSELILTTNRKYSHICSHEIIYGNFIDFLPIFKIADCIKIGKIIIVEVTKVCKECVKVKVVQAGLLYSNMEILLLNNRIKKPVHLKTEEKMDILEAIGYNCDYLIFPCPLNIYILDYMKGIQQIYNRKPIVIGKVQLSQAKLFQTELDFLVKLYDGIWLDDCYPLEGILLDYIFNKCFISKKHILCTSELSTNDICLKGFIGRKTLNSKYIPEIDGLVVENRFKINFRGLTQETYVHMNQEIVWKSKDLLNTRIRYRDINYEYIRKIILLAFKFKATCIVMINESGRSILKLAKLRPLIPILTAFKNSSTAQQFTLCRNVYSNVSAPTSLPWSQFISKQLNDLVVIGKSLDFIENKSQFIFCFQTHVELEECDAFQILIEDELQ